MTSIPHIITVAVPAPLHQAFDYSLTCEQQNAAITPGMRALVPFGPRKLIGIIVKIADHSATPANKLKAALKIYSDEIICPDSIRSMLNWASTYYCHPIGECYQSALPSAVRQAKALPNTELIKWQRSDKPFEGPKNASKQKSILDFIASHPDGVWQDSLKLIKATNKQLQTLRDKGYLIEQRDHALSQAKHSAASILVNLNDQQQAVVTSLQAQQGFQVNLLEGVTGSGKTEVYIKLVEQVVAQGGQALILIPEINLSPQTFARFQSQLSSPIALVHSGLGEREKFTSWQLAKAGHAKVVIGTRSAIFTPFAKLALIVVDEEHDASFKQSDNFKYSARDLAVKRAQLENCPVILGSATPSLESLHQAEQGLYQWLKLGQRAQAQSRLPEIQLIDIKSRPLSDGCSPPLLSAIERELSAGNQVILFQNRRGFAPVLMCDSCGTLIQCQHCDARMTLHSQPPHLCCHHCNSKSAIPHACPNCNYSGLSPIGTGTERIAYGLAQRYPGVPLVRLDRDNIKTQDQLDQALNQIREGEPMLIVGTQMIAKGHDFHNVTLVAVLDADSLFFSADFRAIEKGAQQLIQVAGRAGRGAKTGQVLIQTRLPEHPLFNYLKTHDYLACAQAELKERRECLLPPASKMVAIRADGKDQTLNLQNLEQVASMLKSYVSSHKATEIIGPIEATMARRKGLYRSHLSIISHAPKARSRILLALPSVLKACQQNRVRLSIDVDPMEFL